MNITSSIAFKSGHAPGCAAQPAFIGRLALAHQLASSPSAAENGWIGIIMSITALSLGGSCSSNPKTLVGPQTCQLPVAIIASAKRSIAWTCQAGMLRNMVSKLAGTLESDGSPAATAPAVRAVDAAVS